ncbi:MAG: NCS2 family permease [Zetaproteobacteria bacterium]|nr:NCS2 family permease [Zetaproteobacteria bacterium]
MLENLFKLTERQTDVRTEVIAGLTTFLTAAYIVFVNPNILANTGMDKGALITVTCVVAGLSSILMGLWANAPIMMAPGMGLNAFFAFTLVLGQGVAWQQALGVVFVSGVIFLILTFLGIREKIVKAIPPSLRIATSVGIGLFIAFIGMQGLGLIVRNDAVLVGLGTMNKTVLLGLVGLLLIVILEIKKVKGSILIGILATALAGMALKLSPFPGGLMAMPPSMAPVAFKLDIMGALKVSLWANIFSFMFVDLFDSLGTLLAVCREADLEKDGDIKDLPRMLSADAVATVFGAILGTSTTTSYIESASGVAEGGRTGMTAVTTGVLFILAAFFTPVIGAVQAYATAPALIVVGIFMMRGIGQINFYDFEEGVPAFLTLILMPLTYSIAQGLVFGFITYALIKVFVGKVKDVDPILMVIATLCLVSLLV